MIEVAPNIYYLPGKNKSRFPYCACLYLKGKNIRVLIDAGMGGSNMAQVKDMGIDLLILTHCHIDHRLTRREIPHVPVWCHDKEIPFLCDKDRFFAATGLYRSGVDFNTLFGSLPGMFDIEISRRLADGEDIDLGGLTLLAIHTPGHTPGHLSFYIPEFVLLFSGDVDLTPFGPYYGHDFARIDDFIKSIDKLRRLGAKTVVTGHAGPFRKEVAKHFDDYEAVIYDRDRTVLRHLSQPRPLDYFTRRNVIYSGYPDDSFLLEWFELVHIEKHLERLATTGQVRQDSGLWIRC
jgi:glyoxylase-like metal-dependent hydrolase (beta-lactamase superfamily II)